MFKSGIFSEIFGDEKSDVVYLRPKDWRQRAFAFLTGKTVKLDRRVRQFGRIRTNLFYYITTPMIVITGLVLYAVIGSVGTLLTYFMTNIFLNGLIISLLIFAILKSYHNSYLLFQAACFFKNIEKLIAKDTITEKDMAKIRWRMEKRARLLNTIYMAEALDNIETFGHPNFNDTSARLIKSKLGQRVNTNKANVGFIAGMLVMLGLLGTFLGLLGTIDAVGAAMNSMANIGGDGGEVGMEEMTGFIGSLAAPLQGMGLAFSTSLFGLSGSLMIGFFLHLTGTPQNHFIENVSRWLDDRIVRFKPDLEKTKEAEKIKAKPTDNDLKEWMGGFVHMAVKTHRKLDALSSSINFVGEEMGRTTGQLSTIAEHQGSLVQIASNIDAQMQNVASHGQDVSQRLSGLLETSASIEKVLRGVDGRNQDLATSVRDVLGSLQKIHGQAQHVAGAVENKLKDFDQYMSAQMQNMQSNKAVFEALGQSIQTLESSQNSLAEAQRSGLTDQADILRGMHSVLSELGQSQRSLLEISQKDIGGSEERFKLLSEALSVHLDVQNKLLEAQKKDLDTDIFISLSHAVEDLNTAQQNWIKFNERDAKASHDMLRSMETAFVKLGHSQEDMNGEVKNLLRRLESDPNMKQVESLVLSLKGLMKDIESKAQKIFKSSE